jgi:hydrogenase maturation protease
MRILIREIKFIKIYDLAMDSDHHSEIRNVPARVQVGHSGLLADGDRSFSTLIIGCGNRLCGDDAVGPGLIRRLLQRGLPAEVRCVDGGTEGINVAFQMKGVTHLILVDACQSGGRAGEIFQLKGEEVEPELPPVGLNLHNFRWDHALALGRRLLQQDYPRKVTVFLIEGARFGVGEDLSPEVDRAIDRLIDRMLEWLDDQAAGHPPGVA